MMFVPGKPLPGKSKAAVAETWNNFAGGQKCSMGLGEKIPFVDSFVYLGTLIKRDVSCDDAAVMRNIAKASSAFGASCQCAFGVGIPCDTCIVSAIPYDTTTTGDDDDGRLCR